MPTQLLIQAHQTRQRPSYRSYVKLSCSNLASGRAGRLAGPSVDVHDFPRLVTLYDAPEGIRMSNKIVPGGAGTLASIKHIIVAPCEMNINDYRLQVS